MTEGLVAALHELIDLKRFARALGYQPAGRARQSGEYLSQFRGRGMDFSEVRHYQARDDVRHMEWRVTARTGKPHVKIYQEERERPVVLLADFNPSMLFGTRVALKSVIAARLAALLAWSAAQQGDRVGGLFFSAVKHSEFEPRGRDSGVLPLLASLSHYTNQSEEERQAPPRMLSDALMRVRRVVRPGSILILISDFYHIDEECEQLLYRLSAHNALLAYHICDSIELAPPKPLQYAMSNGQHQLIIDTSIQSVSNAYAHYCDQRMQQVLQLFKRTQIRHIPVTQLIDIPELVRQTFLRRGYG
jgi:uncharacterized protein (DUF58 family)